MNIVARNIEAAAQRKGLNSSEVARRAKTGPTSVYDILSGKSGHPRLDTLRKIAEDGLGVPLIALFVASSEADLDQQIAETLAALPSEKRRDLLAMARALLDQ